MVVCFVGGEKKFVFECPLPWVSSTLLSLEVIGTVYIGNFTLYHTIMAIMSATIIKSVKRSMYLCTIPQIIVVIEQQWPSG